MKIRRFPDHPFVAHIAAKNEVEMLERDGNLICKSLRSTVLFVQIATFLFGTGLTAGVWYSLTHPETAKMPWFWTGLMALLGFICCAVFIRNIFGTPRFEVSGATGEILLFRRRTREPWKRIDRSEISRFRLEPQIYFDEGREVENLVLLLMDASGERRPLCASPEASLIRALAEKMAAMTQRPVEEGAWAGKC
jgi:hypothetical protein